MKANASIPIVFGLKCFFWTIHNPRWCGLRGKNIRIWNSVTFQPRVSICMGRSSTILSPQTSLSFSLTSAGSSKGCAPRAPQTLTSLYIGIAGCGCQSWSPQKELRLKYPQPLLNWTTVEDISNLLHLTNFEVVQSRKHILLPKRLSLVTSIANRYLAHLPLIRQLCLRNWIVARPLPWGTSGVGSQCQ